MDLDSVLPHMRNTVPYFHLFRMATEFEVCLPWVYNALVSMPEVWLRKVPPGGLQQTETRPRRAYNPLLLYSGIRMYANMCAKNGKGPRDFESRQMTAVGDFNRGYFESSVLKEFLNEAAEVCNLRIRCPFLLIRESPS